MQVDLVPPRVARHWLRQLSKEMPTLLMQADKNKKNIGRTQLFQLLRYEAPTGVSKAAWMPSKMNFVFFVPLCADNTGSCFQIESMYPLGFSDILTWGKVQSSTF